VRDASKTFVVPVFSLKFGPNTPEGFWQVQKERLFVSLAICSYFGPVSDPTSHKPKPLSFGLCALCVSVVNSFRLRVLCVFVVKSAFVS
jgi:hypothetical protein